MAAREAVPTRRWFLGAGAAALAWVAIGCSDGDGSTGGAVDEAGGTGASATGGPTSPGTSDSTPVAPTGALRPADFDALGTCVLIPEMAAGPFPNRDQLERRDITEGVPGRPVRLGLRVVDAACAPIPGAVVEVWHADATGDYSSYEDGGGGKDEAEGTTFLRGTQTADGDGILDVATIYPGWYPGRAVHVHVRVRIDDELVLTTQLFFPDEVTAEVLATGAYAEHGPPDTTNDEDGLGGDIATNGSLLSVRPTGEGSEPPLLALLNLGVPAIT